MSKSPVTTEVEAKLLVPDAVRLSAIGRLTHLGPYRLQRRDSVRLHSVYLDTEDFALARSGVALRARRVHGRWEATAKWRGHIDRDVHQRPELNVSLPHTPTMPLALTPGPLYTELAAIVAGRTLAPILVTDIQRRRINVVDLTAGADTQPVAELDLDTVQLRAPGGEAVAALYFEAEIEAVSGGTPEVTQLARLLRRMFDLAATPDSKFARGMQALYGDKNTAPIDPTIQPIDTVAVAARRIVALHLARLRASDPGTRRGDDPEALHDMRVATRRLRALLRAFPEGFPPALAARLGEDLTWLTQELGHVRDVDVQLARLERSTSAGPSGHRTGLRGYRTHLESERRRSREVLLAELDSPRYFTLLRTLERFSTRLVPAARAPANTTGIARAGRQAIRKALRRLRDRAAAVHEAATPEDLHAVRIRAKRLRYLLEFLTDLSGKPGRRVVKRLVRLQDLLGAHHDAIVAAETVRRYIEAGATPPAAASMLALVTFVSSNLNAAESAQGNFRRAWQGFSRRRVSKAFAALLERLQKHDRRFAASESATPRVARLRPPPSTAQPRTPPQVNSA